MRTRNELERLAAAGRPLLSAAESLVDTGERDRILARILASDRPATRPARPRGMALVLVGVAVLAAGAAVAVFESRPGGRPLTRPAGHHHVALRGAKIEMAGYKFRTPTGFKHSAAACMSAPVAGKPRPALDGFAAAASADGGCVEAAYLVGGNKADIPSDAAPVDVGSYHGYFVFQESSGESALYVDLPNAAGDQRLVYLVLFAHGMTEDQLIAVAESGLPTLPLRATTTTCTENCG